MVYWNKKLLPIRRERIKQRLRELSHKPSLNELTRMTIRNLNDFLAINQRLEEDFAIASKGLARASQGFDDDFRELKKLLNHTPPRKYIQKSYEVQRCSYCHENDNPTNLAICEDCGVGIHPDCAEYHGKCPTLHCPSHQQSKTRRRSREI